MTKNFNSGFWLFELSKVIVLELALVAEVPVFLSLFQA